MTQTTRTVRPIPPTVAPDAPGGPIAADAPDAATPTPAATAGPTSTYSEPILFSGTGASRVSEQAVDELLPVVADGAGSQLLSRPPAAPPPLRSANLTGVIGLAVRLHADGHLEQAARIYDQVLASDPDQPVALHALGTLRLQQDRGADAVPLLERAVRLEPTGERLRELGDAYVMVGRWPSAIVTLRRAMERRPHDSHVLRQLAHAWFVHGNFVEAEAVLRRVATAGQTDAAVVASHGFALVQIGRREEAAVQLARALELDPEHQEAAHMLAALRGDNTATAPIRYVRRLFDLYAETFDDHLSDRLEYRVPQQLRALVDGCRPWTGEPDLAVLDLGCGTGLSGAAFADRSRHLVGVDVSPRMLDRAAARAIYDDLHEDALQTHLAECDARYDVIVAADVLIYVGDLETLFALVCSRLAPGGLFACSIETIAASAGEGAGDAAGHQLRPSGRYAHGLQSVQAMAAQVGLTAVATTPTSIRLDAGRPLPGHLLVFSAPGD